MFLYIYSLQDYHIKLIIIKFNTMIQQLNRQLLDPYRTMGNFISGNFNVSYTNPLSFAVPTLTSFKIYSENLSIKVISPCFPHNIKSVATFNQFTYVRSGDYIYKMRFHHCVAQWNISRANQLQQGPKCTLLRFDNIILLAEDNKIFTIIQKQQDTDKQISVLSISHNILKMVHPITYINKVLVYNSQNLSLVNPISQKVLYGYPELGEFLKENNAKINIVEPSNLVDIIAIGLNNGTILIFNIKQSKIIFKMKQKMPAISLAFSTLESIMASGDQYGNIILWDLQNKQILYKMQKVLDGAISDLFFSISQPLLTCGSIVANSIKQLRINRNDNLILTLFRQRLGLKGQILNCSIQNNHDILMNSKIQTMFMSFYSHCNNYTIPRCLDSLLPHHLVSKNFEVHVYKQQTLKQTFKIHEEALFGKIAMSGQYYIVVTKSRALRLGQSLEVKWQISNIYGLELYNQHFIYFFAQDGFYVCDFNTSTIIQAFEDYGYCTNSIKNHTGNLLAFENQTTNTIQIWSMERMSKGRQFQTYQSKTMAIAFSADNNYLLTTHENNQLIIWNIVSGELYKKYQLKNKVVWLGFTPDNQFLLLLQNNAYQIQIWNNYIGRIPASGERTVLQFKTKIHHVESTHRQRLAQFNEAIKIQEANQNMNEDIFDQIPDANDNIHQYDFSHINKWMPLVYYEQLKARNTPEFAKSTSSIPFFLDFRNITEQKQKIRKEALQEEKEKKKNFKENRDKLLANKSHEIILNENSQELDYIAVFQMLKQLSIAEVDYQLRTFLLNPMNKIYIMKMLTNWFSRSDNREIKNIIMYRILQIMSTQILETSISQQVQQLIKLHQKIIQQQQPILSKTIAVTDKLSSRI